MANKLELHVWLVVPKVTHLEEEDIRYVLGLPNSASAAVGVEADFNNLAYSSVESTIDCSEVLIAGAT